jgi:hypothetical protein
MAMHLILTKIDWAIFWAIFSQTYLVTQDLVEKRKHGKREEKGEIEKKRLKK